MADIHLNNPELVGEYLTSLQEQLDAVYITNARLKRRAKKLEVEREALLKQLPLWRKKNKSRRPPKPAPERTLEVPGVGKIPDVSLPAEPVARPELVVAAILDEFSRASFRYEFDLRDIPANDPEEALEACSPDVLLVESAYRGHDGSWVGKVSRFGRPSSDLERVVTWCRHHGVPTVFWVKEDPINHDWFTASASLFDVVLTVDSDMVDSYRKRFGHDRVAVLPFAAQPVIHHAPVVERRPGEVAFAGSFYAAKHAGRRAQFSYVVEPALEHGLHIFDRMDRQQDPRFAWPDQYLSHIVGSLTYPQTLKAYRLYRTFLNVNTVTDSPTMCSRRIYELLASGTRVISGPADALKGVPVEITHDAEETRTLLASDQSHDPAEGLAWIEAGNTSSHRVDQILEMI